MENSNQKTSVKWSNPWFVVVLLAVILLFGVVALSLVRERIVNQQTWQVSFTGQGKVGYEPDIAKISLGVKIDKKPKAEEALSELNLKIQEIVKAVEKAGVGKGDIETQSYSLLPHYDYVENVSRLNGYDANQTIIVKVRKIKEDPERPSQIIKAASDAGANQVNGISFEPDDLEAIKQTAREKAIIDAKQKAVTLSGKIGVELGRVISWWENYNPYTPQPFYSVGGYGVGGGGGEAIVPSGSQEIVIEVSISYLVK